MKQRVHNKVFEMRVFTLVNLLLYLSNIKPYFLTAS